MRVRWVRHAIALLSLFIPLYLVSCSSSQQQDEFGVGDDFDNWNNNYEDGEFDNNYNDDGEWDNNFNDWDDNFDDFDSAGTGFDNGFNDGFGAGLGDNAFAFDNTNNDLSSILAEMDQTDAGMGGIMDATPMNDPYAMDGGFGNLTEVSEGVDPGYVDPGYVDPGVSAPMHHTPTASAMSASPGLPEYGSKMPYIVERGDTLAKIAARVYGNSARWREIADLSSLANPSRIYPGDIVYYQLTEETMNFATTYESLPRQEVVVNVGDTLSTIASRVFGDSTNWKAIWRQNDNISNPDRLEAGMVLHYIVPGSLTAALGQGHQHIAATNIHDVTVDSFEIAEVTLEQQPVDGINYMMALVNKTLNLGVMA